MPLLNSNQEHIIEQILEEAGIDFLKEELFDHLCTDVEQQMEQGKTFENSLKESLSNFGKEGLIKTERQTKFITHQKKYFMRALSFSFLVLMLFVAFTNLSGQDIPSIKPVEAEVSSNFGMRAHPVLKRSRMHRGIDFKAATGTPVLATADGIVMIASMHERYGKRIQIKHDKGISTFYAHLSKINVKKGQKIKQGEVIGAVGSTGFSSAPHLHYEVRKDGKAVDPDKYLQP